MGESTGIAWTDSTFNIAHGCFKVSPGCKNCYAETFTARTTGSKIWGPPATTDRRTFGAKHWNQPHKWNADAQRAGVIRRAFSSSMCDIFEDHPVIERELAKLWPVIRQTPWLDWQLLTKRYDRIATSLPPDWSPTRYPNVWLGVSVENLEWAHIRIQALLALAAPPRVRFISYEPALGPLDRSVLPYLGPHLINWMIYGGESGPGYRDDDPEWPRIAERLCREAGIAYFYKQDAAPRTEMGIQLDGRIVREYPPSRPVPGLLV